MEAFEDQNSVSQNDNKSATGLENLSHVNPPESVIKSKKEKKEKKKDKKKKDKSEKRELKVKDFHDP